MSPELILSSISTLLSAGMLIVGLHVRAAVANLRADLTTKMHETFARRDDMEDVRERLTALEKGMGD